MTDINKALVNAMKPALQLGVDNEKRIEALERGTYRSHGDATCKAIAKMADTFRKDSMRVQDLPHLALTVQCVSAFGMSVSNALPEVFE